MAKPSLKNNMPTVRIDDRDVGHDYGYFDDDRGDDDVGNEDLATGHVCGQLVSSQGQII